MVDEDRFCSHCGIQQQDLGYDQKSKSQITFLGRVWEFIRFCLKLIFAFCVGLIILGVVGNQFLTKDANQINSANKSAGDALQERAVSKPPVVSQEEIEKKRLAKKKLEEEWAEQVKANKEKKEREEREKQEQERIAKENMEQERLAKEQEEKLAKEKLDQERAAKEKLERERLDKERQEQERLSRESNKTKVMNFGNMLEAIDKITAEEMKKVTGLVKSGRVDQTELYMVAKESIASLKSAKYVLFTTSLPEDNT